MRHTCTSKRTEPTEDTHAAGLPVTASFPAELRVDEDVIRSLVVDALDRHHKLRGDPAHAQRYLELHKEKLLETYRGLSNDAA